MLRYRNFRVLDQDIAHVDLALPASAPDQCTGTGCPICSDVHPAQYQMIYRQILCHISKETAVHPVLCFDPDPVDRKGISVVIQRKLWIHRHKTAFALFCSSRSSPAVM